jgi:Gpi18-like mannosyltransferase
VPVFDQVRARARGRLPWIGLIVVALCLRVLLWPHTTLDTTEYLVPWFEQLRRDGGLAAIGQPISNYTPPYLYLLAAMGYLPLDPLVAIKLLSTVTDLALAAVVAGLAGHLRPGRLTGWIAAAAVVLLPPVVLNSALLGQCDALYSTLLLLTLLLVFRDQPRAAGFVIGVALAVKFQAVFLMPVFALLLIRRRVPPTAVPLVIAGWGAAMLPALLAGRPWGDLPQIYLTQLNQFGELTLYAPNIYQWLPADQALTVPGIALAALLVYAVLVAVIGTGVELTDVLVVRVGYLILLLLPFALPRMHERYSYPADVLGVVYAFAVHRGWVVAAAGAVVSGLTYLPFGIGASMPMEALAVAEAGIIVLVTLELVSYLRATRQRERICPDPAEPLAGTARICG